MHEVSGSAGGCGLELKVPDMSEPILRPANQKLRARNESLRGAQGPLQQSEWLASSKQIDDGVARARHSEADASSDALRDAFCRTSRVTR